MTTNATAGGARITAGRAPRTVSHLELIVNQTEPTAESVEERVARHLAAKDWLTTPEHWDQGSAWFRADYLAHAREVIALVREADPAAASAVVAPPTDQAACDCAAEVHMGVGFYHQPQCAIRRAAVLGEPTDRAAALLDAADRFDRMPEASAPALQKGITWATSELRRLATEAQQQAETEAPVCGHVNPEGGERCGLEQSHDWHRRVVPLEVGETSVSWAPTEAAPVTQQPAAEARDQGAVQRVRESLAELRDKGATGMQYYDRILTDLNRATEQPAADETDEERADREATERDHAHGDHTYCGITCEIEMPTEHLRNFVIAKGYPGTRGALDELLRRARAEVAEQQAAAADGEETRRCAHTDIVYGRCVLPIPHDGECVHERQPRCAVPSPDRQHSCVLPPNHEWLHADKHLAEVMPNGSRVVWETPTEAPPSA